MHTIREYTNHDIKSIHSLIEEMQAFEQFLDPKRIRTLEAAEAYLRDLLEKTSHGKGKLLVVEINGEVVGMISVFIEKDYDKHVVDITEYGIITDLIILPEHKNEGVAKDLLKAAEEFIMSRGIDHMFVRVLANHKELLSTYHRHSFKQYETILVKKIS